MARFARGDEHVELVRDGRTVIEGSAFGEARRELHDERAALIAYYARIAELLDDRWARHTPFVDDLVIADEPDLARAVDAGDPDALAIYTDWLLERGDPRGELAALRAAAAPDLRAIASLEKTRGVELFGPLALLGRPWREQFAYGWRGGWIDEIAFRHVDGARLQPEEMMQHALHAPMARFVRWLSLDSWYARTVLERLAGCSCVERIRGVRIEDGWCDALLLDALPNLEELELLDADSVDGGHPRVSRLRLTIDLGIPSIGGEWPALRRLDLVVTTAIGTARGMLALLERPTLREVTIEAPAVPEPVAERLEQLRERLDIRVALRPANR